MYRGVSRECCAALVNVLDESAIGEFETIVDWAPVVPAPDTMPRQVSINAEAADLVRSVADRFGNKYFRPSRCSPAPLSSSATGTATIPWARSPCRPCVEAGGHRGPV